MNSTGINSAQGHSLGSAYLLPVFLGLIGLFVLAYYQSIEVLMVLWLGLEEVSDNSGLLALACTAYLLYLKRDQLQSAPVRPSKLAGLGLFGLSLLWFVAVETGVQSASQGLLPFIFLAAIAFVFGMPVLKLTLVPVLILLFVIPVWWPLLPYLRDITTATAEFNLKLLNRPVFVDNYILHLPGGSFLVDESCAGLRFLLVTSLLTLVCKDMFSLSVPKTILLGLVGIALAFVANWIRVLVIVLVGDYTQMRSGLVEDHANLGWVIYGVLVLVPFYVLNNYLAESGSASAAKAGDGKGQGIGRARFLGFVTVGALLLVSGPILSFAMAVQAGSDRVLRLPPAAGAVRQINPSAAAGISRWQPEFVNTTQYLTDRYAVAGKPVDVHVAYYRQQQQGAELINVNNEFADGSVWIEEDTVVNHLENPGVNDGLTVTALTLRGPGGQRRLVWYWYNVGGRQTVSPVSAKLFEIVGLFTGRSDASMIAISTTCNPACAEAEPVLDSFLQEMYPSLEDLAGVSGAGRD